MHSSPGIARPTTDPSRSRRLSGGGRRQVEHELGTRPKEIAASERSALGQLLNGQFVQMNLDIGRKLRERRLSKNYRSYRQY